MLGVHEVPDRYGEATPLLPSSPGECMALFRLDGILRRVLDCERF